MSYLINNTVLSLRIENWTHERLGCSVQSILQHQFVISKIAPCKRNPYFPLPKKLTNLMEGLIQNECFRLCLVRYLNPVNKNPAIIGNIDIEFAKQLNFKSMKFPFQKKN